MRVPAFDSSRECLPPFPSSIPRRVNCARKYIGRKCLYSFQLRPLRNCIEQKFQMCKRATLCLPHAGQFEMFSRLFSFRRGYNLIARISERASSEGAARLIRKRIRGKRADVLSRFIREATRRRFRATSKADAGGGVETRRRLHAQLISSIIPNRRQS